MVVSAVCLACGDGGGNVPMSDAGPDAATRAVVSIAVMPPMVTLEPKATQQLTATATYDDNSTQDVTSLAAWSTPDPTVAQVDGVGMVMANAGGHVTITASFRNVSGSSAITVRGLQLTDDTFLWRPPDAQTYPDDLALVSAADGRMIVVVSAQGPSARVLTSFFYDGQSPAMWPEKPISPADYTTTSAMDEEVAIGGTAEAALVYRRTDGTNIDNAHFGLAYFAAASWTILPTQTGALVPQYDNAFASWPVAMDMQGRFYVPYDNSQSSTLNVARFGSQGLIDDVPLNPSSGPGGEVAMVANGQGQVMLFDTQAGSRTFDGNTWGQVKTYGPNPGPGPLFLRLGNDGKADFLTLSLVLRHYHYDGFGWDSGRTLANLSVAPAAAAGDESGRLVVAYGPSGPLPNMHIDVQAYDGTTWTSPMQLDTDGSGDHAFVGSDGAGHFLVVWPSRTAWFATLYDGAWNAPWPLDFIPNQMAMRPDGKVVFLRHEGDGIYAAVYQLVL